MDPRDPESSGPPSPPDPGPCRHPPTACPPPAEQLRAAARPSGPGIRPPIGALQPGFSCSHREQISVARTAYRTLGKDGFRSQAGSFARTFRRLLPTTTPVTPVVARASFP